MLAALLLALAVPREALVDDAPTQLTVARAGEPMRGVAEYGAALAAFTAMNAAGSALLSGARFNVSKGGDVSSNGTGSLVGAGTCIVLSPLAAALASWLVGKGSDTWDPSLGWATFGAYGSSLVAVGAGLGLAAMNLDRGAAVAANTALYLAVPLGTVLVQNATKSEKRQ